MNTSHASIEHEPSSKEFVQYKQQQTENASTLIKSILLVNQSIPSHLNERELREAVRFDSHGKFLDEGLFEVLRSHRVMPVWGNLELNQIPSYLLPAVLQLKNGQYCVLKRVENGDAWISQSGYPDAERKLLIDELIDQYSGTALFIQKKPETTSHQLVPPDRDAFQWFWSTLWRFRSYYIESMMANIVANFLTIAVVFFAMNVYDRVVPTQAYTSLWTLAIGTMIAVMLEFLMRWFKASLVDIGGKKTDIAINAALLREILAIRLEHRPQSIGIFSSAMRDFEALRDFFSSASLVLISDLPFILMFLGLIWLIAGPLVWIPAAMIPVLVLIGLLAQYPLMKAMRTNMKESGDKQSVLVESLLNLELIKSHRAEEYLQQRWDHSNHAAAMAYKKARSLTNLMLGITAMLQQLVTIGMIVIGVYMIGDNLLTLGALIASVILAGRAISPLGNVMALAARYQQASASLETLEQLMQRPRDRQRDRHYVRPTSMNGGLTSVELEYAYPGEHKLPVIKRISLDIKPGTHMGLLGRVGCGKSTLIRLMSGLYTPLGGHILVDGVDLQQIDPSDLRDQIGYVGQDAQLFMGSVRDNLVLSNPSITDSAIIDVLKKLDLYQMVASHPKGLDMPLAEAGNGMSGGQRQLLAIARMMLRNPKFVFMDEPTSHMDQQSEKRVIDVLGEWLKGRTLILATHRLQLLTWVDQIAVLEKGQVIASGERDDILKQLTTGIPAPKQARGRPPKQQQPDLEHR
jgi:ATP-binding cassette subfamily C protein LapB